MFVAVSLGTIVYSVLWEIAKSIGGRAASEFLYKRIKQKFEKKKNKSLEKTNLNEADLELIRKILQEELSAFGVKNSEVDLLLLNSLTKLSDEHNQILNRLESIETVLMRLAAGLMYEIYLEGSSVPISVTEELVKQYLLGNEVSEKKINEYISENLYSPRIKEKLEHYSPFKELYRAEKAVIARFVTKFLEEKDSIHHLGILSELWAIIAAEDLETSKILCGIALELIKKESEHAFELKNLLRFLHLLDVSNGITTLDEIAKRNIMDFLVKKIEKAPCYEQLEIAYFLMKLGKKEHYIIQVIEKALVELQNQKYSDKFVKESASVSPKVIRFFKKLAGTKTKVSKTIKILSSLTSRLKRRKFERSTELLEGQLTRTLSEINILVTSVENADKEQLKTIKLILNDLIQLLLKASTKEKISDSHRLLMWKIIDNAVYIINKMAILNTKRVLENWEVNLARIHGLYSEELGEYKLSSEKELRKFMKSFRISQEFVKKVEEEWKKELIDTLPEPPKKIEGKAKVEN